jgi:uncharacterized protein YbjT (DUF2867 family)
MATQTKASKRLLILGATGGIGRALTDQAIERGHQVTAFVRSPEKLGAPRDGVTARKGDPRNADELREALTRHDAVLSAGAHPDRGRRRSTAIARALPWRPCMPPASAGC